MSTVSALEAVCVNVSPKTNWTFIRVDADTGERGWGECSLNRWEALLIAGAGMLRDDIVGKTVEQAFGALDAIAHSPGGMVIHAVKSAVEQALCDIQAQREELPVHAWLGRTHRRSVAAYANINRGITVRNPEGFAGAALAALAMGYRSIKIAPFDGVISQDARSTPIDERIRLGIERIRAVRAAIGPDVPLMVDCHWRFDPERAAALLLALRDVGPHWIECPISEHPSLFADIARLRAIANGHGIALAGGEGIFVIEQARAMCTTKLYDVLMPDIKYAGGYRGMLAIAELCSEHGVQFSPHNPTGPIAHLASVHLCAASPTLLWLEHQCAETPLFDALAGGCVAPLVEGAFVVPDAPGLGAMLDEDLASSLSWRRLPASVVLDERLG